MCTVNILRGVVRNKNTEKKKKNKKPIQTTIVRHTKYINYNIIEIKFKLYIWTVYDN